jgi:hypothetical protein
MEASLRKLCLRYIFLATARRPDGLPRGSKATGVMTRMMRRGCVLTRHHLRTRLIYYCSPFPVVSFPAMGAEADAGIRSANSPIGLESQPAQESTFCAGASCVSRFAAKTTRTRVQTNNIASVRGRKERLNRLVSMSL